MSGSSILNVMREATRKAAGPLRRDFGELENLQATRKGPADFVTVADRRTEEIVRRELERARPGYGFLGEESGEISGSDSSHRWIVDPVDGTTNLLHGIPQFAVSIALERDGELVAGVIHNPISEETFSAARGEGARLNGRRIRVASRSRLAECVIGSGTPFLGHGDHAVFLRESAALASRSAGLRRLGSASLDLAWTAAGRFDAYWERHLKPWDIAAGIVLAREAGGLAIDPDDESVSPLESGAILVANESLLPLIRERLRLSGAG